MEDFVVVCEDNQIPIDGECYTIDELQELLRRLTQSTKQGNRVDAARFCDILKQVKQYDTDLKQNLPKAHKDQVKAFIQQSQSWLNTVSQVCSIQGGKKRRTRKRTTKRRKRPAKRCAHKK